MSSPTTPPTAVDSPGEAAQSSLIAEESLADIPPLTTFTARSTADIIAALRLVADGVAQQRQLGSRILIFHPLVLAAYFALLALIGQLLYSSPDDLALVFTTAAGITMAALLTVRYSVQGYLSLAEQINFSWLKAPLQTDGGGTEGSEVTQGEDEVLVTKFGDEIIGTLIIRTVTVPAESGSHKGKRRRTEKGIFRAWAVRLKYRGKGVGTNLLAEGVKTVREKLGEGAVVEWAQDHASQFSFFPHPLNPTAMLPLF